MKRITHVMRSPVVGGSELETLEITRSLDMFRHRIVFPREFADWTPTILDRFGADVSIEVVDELNARLAAAADEIIHIQFPFVVAPGYGMHESVLVLWRMPPVPTVFTVHAAVNVPVVDGIDYIFHTEALAQRFADRLARERVTVCPSLVRPLLVDGSERGGDGGARPPRVLWVSRNEDAKFHPQIPEIIARVLSLAPNAEFRFVGAPAGLRLDIDPRVSVTPCPAADLEAEYRQADVFWHFPHPRLEETWCRTVTEAMGAGLPCVVAAHGAMRTQVTDGVTGFVVATPEACAEALAELVRSAQGRAAMGSAASRRAAAFYESARGVLGELYSKLMV